MNNVNTTAVFEGARGRPSQLTVSDEHPWGLLGLLIKNRNGDMPPARSQPSGLSADVSLLASSWDRSPDWPPEIYPIPVRVPPWGDLGVPVGLTGRICPFCLGLVSLGHWPPPSSSLR